MGLLKGLYLDGDGWRVVAAVGKGYILMVVGKGQLRGLERAIS